MYSDQLPLVSVCVLSMNHENYVLQCLQSVAVQDYPHLEVVFLDNNSKDRSFETGRDFLERAGIPFRCSKREKNYLTSPNFNFLLNQAAGKYACMISADDWMAPENISRKVERLIQDDEVVYVYSEAYTYYDNTGSTEESPTVGRLPEGYIFDQLILSNFVTAPGSVLDVAKTKELGGFRDDIFIEDWDMLLRVSQRYKIAYVPLHLVYYRRHSSNTSSPISVRYVREKLEILAQYRDHKNYSASQEHIIESWIYSTVELDKPLAALKVLLRNFHFRPFYFRQLAKWMLLAPRKAFKQKK